MFFAPEDLIREEASSLLADLYALYEFETYKIFDDFRDSFSEVASQVDERISRRLLSLATLARVNDDLGGGLAVHATRKAEGVGLLIEGRKESVLTAREACNKIIHSDGS